MEQTDIRVVNLETVVLQRETEVIVGPEGVFVGGEQQVEERVDGSLHAVLFGEGHWILHDERASDVHGFSIKGWDIHRQLHQLPPARFEQVGFRQTQVWEGFRTL